jgi:hypothetical protein
MSHSQSFRLWKHKSLTIKGISIHSQHNLPEFIDESVHSSPGSHKFEFEIPQNIKKTTRRIATMKIISIVSFLLFAVAIDAKQPPSKSTREIINSRQLMDEWCCKYLYVHACAFVRRVLRKILTDTIMEFSASLRPTQRPSVKPGLLSSLPSGLLSTLPSDIPSTLPSDIPLDILSSHPLNFLRILQQ